MATEQDIIIDRRGWEHLAQVDRQYKEINGAAVPDPDPEN